MKKLYLAIFLLCFVIVANAQLDSIKQSLDDSISVKTDKVRTINDSLESIRGFLSSQAQKLQASSIAVKDLDNNIKQLAANKDSLQKVKDSLQNVVENVQKQSNTEITKNRAEIEKTKKLLADVTKVLNHRQDSLQNIIKQQIITINSNDSTLHIQDSFTRTKDSINKKRSVDIKSKDSIIHIQDSVSEKLAVDIEERKAAIAKQLDSLETIAKIEMRDSIMIFNSDNNRKKYRVKINEINISVHEGIIMEIIVKTDSGIYRNKYAIIDLLHFGQRGKTDKLNYEHQDYLKYNDNSHVFLDDAIKYTPIRSYNDVAYGDFQITLLPIDEDRFYLLRESTSINTYFNVAAFTDIKGISGDPNGIAQFTADAKFITNTRNFRNGAIVSLNYITFHGGLAKFDSQFKGTDLKNDDSVSRKDLFQRSTYSVGLKLNLLHAFASPYPRHLINDWQINVGYNFLGTKLFDTSFKDAARTIIDTAYHNITQNQWYVEPTMTFSRHKNFSLSIALPFYLNNLKKSNGVIIKNGGSEYWAAPGISMMYYGKRDIGSKIFFRYNHYINLKDDTQAFTQLQLGYSINLTQVWSNNQK